MTVPTEGLSTQPPKSLAADCPPHIYVARIHRRGLKILKYKSHPANSLFKSLPSGRRLRAIKTKTSSFLNSTYCRTITSLNNFNHNCTSTSCRHTLLVALYNILRLLYICTMYLFIGLYADLHITCTYKHL